MTLAIINGLPTFINVVNQDQPFNINKESFIYDDFIIGNNSITYKNSTYGAGSRVDFSQQGETGVAGILRFVGGTGNSARAGGIMSSNQLKNFSDYSKIVLVYKYRLDIIPTNANTACIQMGFINSNSTLNNANHIVYKLDIGNVSSTNISRFTTWYIEVRSANTVTKRINTNLSVDTNWHTLKIEYNNPTNIRNEASMSFYLDDNLVASLNGLDIVGYLTSDSAFNSNGACVFRASTNLSVIGLRLDYIYYYKRLV